MKLIYLSPLISLFLGYYIAEGRDYTPPALPQGERYVSGQLFGVPDVPAHMVLALMPSRASLLGERAIDKITVTKPNPNKRVEYSYGWGPEREFAKLDRQAAGRIDGSRKQNFTWHKVTSPTAESYSGGTAIYNMTANSYAEIYAVPSGSVTISDNPYHTFWMGYLVGQI